jgi:hypothetical protein
VHWWVRGDINLGGFVVELVPIVRLKRRARLNVGGKVKPLHRNQKCITPNFFYIGGLLLIDYRPIPPIECSVSEYFFDGFVELVPFCEA